MKNEWASLSYDFSVCILTFLTATWRYRVNQDPPVHCPLDAIMTQLWMNIKWVTITEDAQIFLSLIWTSHEALPKENLVYLDTMFYIGFAPPKKAGGQFQIEIASNIWKCGAILKRNCSRHLKCKAILKLNCSCHLKMWAISFWNVGNFVLKSHRPS